MVKLGMVYLIGRDIINSCVVYFMFMISYWNRVDMGRGGNEFGENQWCMFHFWR